MAGNQTDVTNENKKTAADGIFRKKSIERVSGPEELNDYIRVTTPSVWIVLISLAVLLLGILAWSIFGTLEVKNENGETQTIHPISYITNG